MKFIIEKYGEYAVIVKDDSGKILVSVQRNPDSYSYSINPGGNINVLSVSEGSFIVIQTGDE